MKKLIQVLLGGAILMMAAPLAYAEGVKYKEGTHVLFSGVTCSSEAAQWALIAQIIKDKTFVKRPVDITVECSSPTTKSLLVLSKKFGSFSKSGDIYELWATEVFAYTMGSLQIYLPVPEAKYINLLVGAGV